MSAETDRLREVYDRLQRQLHQAEVAEAYGTGNPAQMRRTKAAIADVEGKLRLAGVWTTTALQAHENALRGMVYKLSEAYDHAVAVGSDPKHIESLRQQLHNAKVNLYDVAHNGNVPKEAAPKLTVREDDLANIASREERMLRIAEREREAMHRTSDPVNEGIAAAMKWLEQVLGRGNGVKDNVTIDYNWTTKANVQWVESDEYVPTIGGEFLVPYEDMMRLMEKFSEAMEERE